jgi:hypothetical protein
MSGANDYGEPWNNLREECEHCGVAIRDRDSSFDSDSEDRAIACVNALQGIADPEAFVKAADRVRALADSTNTDDAEDAWMSYDSARGKS